MTPPSAMNDKDGARVAMVVRDEAGLFHVEVEGFCLWHFETELVARSYCSSVNAALAPRIQAAKDEGFKKGYEQCKKEFADWGMAT